MRLVCCLFLVLVTAATVGAPTEAQVGETYCSVTGISARQLSNGVQVTIEADGEMHWWVEWDDVVESGGGYWKEFDWGWDIEFTEDFTTLPILIHNAKSKLGAGFVPISKYPVSHAEISIPDWCADEGVGIRVDLVNYLGLVGGEGDDERWRYGFYYDSSEDQSKIIVSWQSDQFPAPPEAETPQDLAREIWVEMREDGLAVHAVNAPLGDVLGAISRATGYPIAIPADKDVRVSAELRGKTAGEALQLVATGVGLCAGACPEGGWIVAEARAAAGGYGVAEMRVFQLEHTKASRLLTLMPTMLLDYLRADDESNTIIVNAPAWMMGRIAHDIATLDSAPLELLLDVVILEAASTENLLRQLTLTRSLGDFSASAAAFGGELELVWLEGQQSAWRVALEAREDKSDYQVRADASLRVANGRTARIFAGQQRFIIIESLEEGLTADIEAVDVGTSLDVQPRLGIGDEVVLSLAVSTRTLRGGGGPGALPVVGARRADNVVRVRDGETLVIAGLREEIATREGRRIPVLGWLPLIGSAFEAPVRESRQTELAIFVTPHIMRTEPAQGGEVVHG